MMDAIYANSSARTVVKNADLENVIDVNLDGHGFHTYSNVSLLMMIAIELKEKYLMTLIMSLVIIILQDIYNILTIV